MNRRPDGQGRVAPDTTLSGVPRAPGVPPTPRETAREHLRNAQSLLGELYQGKLMAGERFGVPLSISEVVEISAAVYERVSLALDQIEAGNP